MRDSKSLALVLALATGSALLPVRPAAAAPAEPFQQSSVQPSCNGKTTCTFVFTKVPAGKTLTISHVSCTIVTGGLSGGVSQSFLYSSEFGIAKAYDVLLASPYVQGGSNIQSIVNAATLFFVDAGFSPVVGVTTSSTIVSGAGAAGAECFVSGTLS